MTTETPATTDLSLEDWYKEAEKLRQAWLLGLIDHAEALGKLEKLLDRLDITKE